MNSTQLVVLAVATAGCALAISACGSSGTLRATTSGSSPSHYNTQLAFSRCMRSHGVPNFPDPTPNPASTSGVVRVVLGIVLPSNLNLKSPAFRSGLNTCRKLIVGAAPHEVSASQKLEAVEMAECMRKHGVPNFPDPTFPAGGGIAESVGPGADPESPAFQHAQAVCGGAKR
jgi:hypothetical protein